MAVSVLDSFVDLGTGTLSPSAGNNRFLLIFQHMTGSTNTVSAATFGGQALTLEASVSDSTVGFPTHMNVWSLDEAGIAAAGASSSFAITAGTVNGSDERTAVVLQDVDQTNPVVATASGQGVVSGVSAFSLTTVDGGYAAAGAMYDHDAASDALNWGSDLTERVEVQTSGTGNTYSTADTLTTTTSISVSVSTPDDTAGDEQKCAVAISLRGADQTAALGRVTETNTARALTPTVVEALGRVTETSNAGALTHAKSVALGRATETSTARRLLLAVFGRATGTMTTGNSADGNILKFARAVSTMTTGGTANANQTFINASASGGMTTGNRANAEEPASIFPTADLSQSFATRQKPVFLVDLLFDTSPLYIWTLPFAAEFAFKNYVKLAGINSGFTLTNSLDAATGDASLQLTGNSEELRNIALTENYRNRKAEIFLANADLNNQIVAIEKIFVGRITNMTLSNARDSATVSIILQSIFRNLNNPIKINRISSADLKLRSPGDTFLDSIETVQIPEPRFGQA